MGNVCCWKKDRRRGPCNEVRWVEFVMCCICVIFTIVASELQYFRPSQFYIVFYFVPIMYMLVTFYDILVICAYYPIGWRAWILFAISATLMFVLCAGGSPIILVKWWFVYTILYLITALVFLIDAICVVRLVALFAPKSQRDIDDCCNPYCNTKFSQVVPAQEPVEHNYAQTREPHEYEEEELRNYDKHHHSPRYRRSETDYQLSHIVAAPSTSYEIEFERQMQSYSTSYFVHLDTVRKHKQIADDVRQQHQMAMNHCAGDMFVAPSRNKVTAVSRIPTLRELKTQDIDLTPLKSPFTAKEKSLIHFKQTTRDLDYINKK